MQFIILGVLFVLAVGPVSGQVVVQSAPAGQSPVTGPRDNAAPKDTGTARISGRVVNAETGAPLRRAVVFVMGEGLKRPFGARTDDAGRYEIKDLPAGRFVVSANKNGYVALNYGQKRQSEPGKPLDLKDGQVTARVDFALSKGGVVTGRVTDELGEPLANVGVRAMRYSRAAGKRQLGQVGGTSTDDRGQFRIFGLAAGDYYFSAVYSEDGMEFAEPESGTGYAPTYYPGTPSAADAQRVRVVAGAEQGPLVFALIPARGAKVSGTVITSNGEPPSIGFVMLQSGSPEDGSFDMRGGSVIQSDGTFALSSVTPGEYTLIANLGGMGREEDAETASVPLTVAGEDVTGVTITTSKPTPISGQLLFDGTAPDKARPSEVLLWLRAESPAAMMMSGGPLTMKDDWTFVGRVSGGPLIVEPARLPDGFMLKAVLLDGEDVTDSGITPHGTPIEGVQVVLTNHLTKLTGVATDGSGRPARDYQVVIFPDDPTQWRKVSRRQQTVAPDQQGRFELARLPPGHYLAAAVENIEEGQAQDPEFLESVRASATAFELREGETKTVTLKLSARQ